MWPRAAAPTVTNAFYDEPLVMLIGATATTACLMLFAIMHPSRKALRDDECEIVVDMPNHPDNARESEPLIMMESKQYEDRATKHADVRLRELTARSNQRRVDAGSLQKEPVSHGSPQKEPMSPDSLQKRLGGSPQGRTGPSPQRKIHVFGDKYRVTGNKKINMRSGVSLESDSLGCLEVNTEVVVYEKEWFENKALRACVKPLEGPLKGRLGWVTMDKATGPLLAKVAGQDDAVLAVKQTGQDDAVVPTARATHLLHRAKDLPQLAMPSASPSQAIMPTVDGSSGARDIVDKTSPTWEPRWPISDVAAGAGGWGGAHTPRTASRNWANQPGAERPYDIFVSFRFCEAEVQANALKVELERRDYKTFVSNESPGADLHEAISAALGDSKCQVLLATRSYGLKTNGLFSTFQEMDWSIENGNVFLVKMPPDVKWTEMPTQLALGSLMWTPWQLDAPDVPPGLVDAIIEKATLGRSPPIARTPRSTASASLSQAGTPRSAASASPLSSQVTDGATPTESNSHSQRGGARVGRMLRKLSWRSAT